MYAWLSVLVWVRLSIAVLLIAGNVYGWCMLIIVGLAHILLH